jgi:nitronate monooxygenase
VDHSAAKSFLRRLRIPLIAAPMTAVSGFDLAVAAAAAGIGAAFPVHNVSSPAELDRWLADLVGLPGPVLPNLVVHRTNQRLAEDLAVITKHPVPAVITSVGSPCDVVAPLHDAGMYVFADVASMRHAERAIDAGVDGLVLLTAGAGGQTGWANPMVFARAVRRIWDGPLVLAGGITDGTSLVAARVLGFDAVYMGTPFIATVESAATSHWKEAVALASIDDIELTSAVTGLATNMIRFAGLAAPARRHTGKFAMAALDTDTDPPDPNGWGPFSAGHSAAGVDAIVPVDELIARIEREVMSTLDECPDIRIFK